MYNKNVRYESDYYSLERNSMTIIIGAKCKDSIILASDSQATNKSNGFKRLNAPKIFSDNTLDNKISFIYAGANDVFLCDTLIKQIKDKYEKTIKDKIKIETARDFADCCIEKSIAELNMRYSHVRELNKNGLLEYRMLIGVVLKEIGDYELFLAEPNGIARGYRDKIQTLGTKSELAEYIIARLLESSKKTISEYSGYEMLDFILYLVYQIKQFDLYCGGKTQYIQINKSGNLISPKTMKEVDDFENEKIIEIDRKYKKILDEILGHEKEKDQ